MARYPTKEAVFLKIKDLENETKALINQLSSENLRDTISTKKKLHKIGVEISKLKQQYSI